MVKPLTAIQIPKLIRRYENKRCSTGLTLEVPKILGSSLFFNVPAPTEGRVEDRTMIFPPIGACTALSTLYYINWIIEDTYHKLVAGLQGGSHCTTNDAVVLEHIPNSA